jgi:hypothetical protein
MKVDLSPAVNRFVESILTVCKASHNEMAAYKNIPIEYLPQIRSYFKSQGKKTHIRFRGSRTNPLDRRDRSQRMQDCVKQFADRFSVYFK